MSIFDLDVDEELPKIEKREKKPKKRKTEIKKEKKKTQNNELKKEIETLKKEVVEVKENLATLTSTLNEIKEITQQTLKILNKLYSETRNTIPQSTIEKKTEKTSISRGNEIHQSDLEAFIIWLWNRNKFVKPYQVAQELGIPNEKARKLLRMANNQLITVKRKTSDRHQLNVFNPKVLEILKNEPVELIKEKQEELLRDYKAGKIVEEIPKEWIKVIK